MRRFAVACLLIGSALLVSSPAAAQSASRPAVFLNVNAALHEGPQRLAVSVPSVVFAQEGALVVDDRIGGATALDLFGGVRAGRFLFGAGYQRSATTSNHEFVGTTKPVSAGSFTRHFNALTPAMDHRETVVYLSAGVGRQITDRFDLAISGGPAFFKLRQDLPESIVQTDDVFGHFLSMATRRVDESAIGFQAAVDFNYMFHPRIGAGGVARYSRASVDLPDATETMTLGGIQFGAGLRVRF